jgi:predicted ATP-dependent endonuclease of OLD family
VILYILPALQSYLLIKEGDQMKLVELSIENFRGINGDGNKIMFDDSDIIFLFGQNNIGKSSFLDAYEYFVTQKIKAVESDFYLNDLSKEITMYAVFQKEDGDDEYFEKQGLNKWVVPDCNRVYFKKVWSKAGKVGDKYTYDPEKEEYKLNGFGGLETFLSKAAPTPIKIEAMPTPDSLQKWISDVLKKQVLKTISNDEQEAFSDALNAIQVLQEKIENKDILQTMANQANENFQKVFPELKMLIESGDSKDIDINKLFEKEFSVSISKDDGKETQSWSTHGHGVIRQAMFNFLGISKSSNECSSEGVCKKDFILLFEEPELYLHPHKIRMLRESLYSLCSDSRYQILCVSHNPQLIDISKPHVSLARCVKNSDETTSIYQAGKDIFAKDDDVKERVRMINIFNPHVCEAFFSDQVVMVEGDTEAIVLREYLNRFYSDNDLFVLNTGTKNNMPFFIKALSHFMIKNCVIHDSDCRYLYNKKGEALLKKDEEKRLNSAWSLNQSIWDEINEANTRTPKLSCRFVHVRNFEDAHGYKHDQAKGKPMSAFEYSKELVQGDEKPIVSFIEKIINEGYEDLYTPEYLEEVVKEPY